MAPQSEDAVRSTSAGPGVSEKAKDQGHQELSSGGLERKWKTKTQVKMSDNVFGFSGKNLKMPIFMELDTTRY